MHAMISFLLVLICAHIANVILKDFVWITYPLGNRGDYRTHSLIHSSGMYKLVSVYSQVFLVFASIVCVKLSNKTCLFLLS